MDSVGVAGQGVKEEWHRIKKPAEQPPPGPGRHAEVAIALGWPKLGSWILEMRDRFDRHEHLKREREHRSHPTFCARMRVAVQTTEVEFGVDTPIEVSLIFSGSSSSAAIVSS